MRILTRDGRSGVDDPFLELTARVYADDPWWIPEEPLDVSSAFSDANDWFAKGKAITMCVPGAARLAVFRSNDCHIEGQPAAFFGYWEHLGAGGANEALFRDAMAWAREQGATRLYGPINFTTHSAYRLRLDAVRRERPFVGEPYNPPSYPSVLESCGFSLARRYITQISSERLSADRIELARAALVSAGYSLAPLDAVRWRELLPQLEPLLGVIFAQNFAFIPVSYENFARGYAEAAARRLCPRTSVLAYGPGGDIAGIALIYPDYGSLVVQGAGRNRVKASDLSFAEHASLLDARGERTGIVRTVGVAPPHRGRGLSNALGASVLARGAAHYDRWMAALIREDNISRRFGDSQRHSERAYGLYVRCLDGAAA